METIKLPSQGKGYPPDFFEKTYGICADDPIIINHEGIREDEVEECV